MPRTVRAFLWGGLIGLLAACASQPAPPSKPVDILSWDRNPNTIIFQLNQAYEGEDPILAKNRLPACTLFGNNHLVWINYDAKLGEQLLETQIDDGTVISFLEFLIRDQKFYGLPDYSKQGVPPAVTPPAHLEITSITLFLNNEVHTISNYRAWPNDTYNAILTQCGKLSTTVAVFKPRGVWVSAVRLPGVTGGVAVPWPETAPFSLSSLADSKQRKWLGASPTLDRVWDLTRRTEGTVQWLELGKSYLIGVEVPGLTTSAPGQPTPVPVSTPSPTA